MRLNKSSTALLIAGAVASALAQAAGSPDQSMISKVDTVYVREAKGLYIEKKLLRKTENKEVWVNVRFATSLPGGPTSELFQVPADIAIERGDLVTTRIGDPTPRDLNLIAKANQVTQLVAKHDTLMAMAFGLSNTARTKGLYAEAQACLSLTPIRVAYAGPFIR